MSNIYYQNLIQNVLDASASDNWKDAVLEWSIVDCEEDESCSSSCVCGKENLRYLFTIRNDRTGKFLYPIGSIKKFEHADLDEEVNVKYPRLKSRVLHGKLLAMYFGRDNLQEIVLRKGSLLDYHYQNSCDKPDSISKEEWQQRAVDWKKSNWTRLYTWESWVWCKSFSV